MGFHHMKVNAQIGLLEVYKYYWKVLFGGNGR